MRRLLFALALVPALVVSACASSSTPGDASSAQPQARDAAPVIAAERAFAARAGEIGWIPAFREYTAPDGQLIGQAGLVSAPERMNALPDDGEKGLYWQPAYAGIARSGDLGFTTGPVSFDAARTPRIQYFTVWRKQPDGSWKWIFDGGPGPVAEPGPIVADDAQVAMLAVAATSAGTAAQANAEVSALEAGATTSAGLARYLSSDAHVYRAGQTRAYGGADAAARMVYPTGDIAYHVTRTESSSAGDMVFSLGEARWTRDAAERQGFFARIWQHRSEGWRIVYDQLVARPAPPAASN